MGFMNPTDNKLLLDEVYKKGNWLDFYQCCIQHMLCTVELQEAFHSFWVEKGHRIRSQINDDTQLLHILRLMLPPYTGDGQWLYRGENVARYKAGNIGFCWTDKEGIAKMFVSGLNAYKTGGVLLKAWAPSTAIITSPNEHSKYLGEDEITVDGLSVEKLQILQKFPAPQCKK